MHLVLVLGFQRATQRLTKISEITEDKQMYDEREKAIRDRTI